MKNTGRTLVAAMAAFGLFAVSPLTAGTQYFDAAGGTKNWSGNWANSSHGSYDQAWGNGSDANFEGTGGAVNVDNSYSIGSAVFAVDGYTLNSGTLSLTGGGNMNGTGFVIGSGTATVNSTLNGGQNLVKLGAGTVILTGANSYGGGTDANEGTLSVSAISDTAGQASNIGYGYLSVNYGGTLQYTGADSVTTNRALWIDRAAGAYGGPNAEGATFDITQGSLVFTGANGGGIDRNLTKNGAGALGLNIAISGAAHVTANSGTLTLGDSNTYTGGTAIEGGTLVASSIADSGASSVGTGYFAIVNGGILRYTGGTVTTNRELWIDRGAGGTIDVTDSAATLTVSPANGACTTNFTKTGAGSLVMNTAISSTAKVMVTGGAPDAWRLQHLHRRHRHRRRHTRRLVHRRFRREQRWHRLFRHRQRCDTPLYRWHRHHEPGTLDRSRRRRHVRRGQRLDDTYHPVGRRRAKRKRRQDRGRIARTESHHRQFRRGYRPRRLPDA